MIKYRDAEPAMYLPDNFKDPDMVALSYACKKAMEKMLEYQKGLPMMADIDALDEDILDLLALEKNTQYYDQSLPIDQKRELIRQTNVWYAKGGTVSAVQEMVDILFGYGTVVEWDKFDDGPGTPGEFEIVTSSDIPDEAFKGLSGIIDRVKRLTAHLRSVRMRDSVEWKNYHEFQILAQIEWYARYSVKYLDGTWLLNGEEDLNGTKGNAFDLNPIRKIDLDVSHKTEEKFSTVTMRREIYLDGTWLLNGSQKLDHGVEYSL